MDDDSAVDGRPRCDRRGIGAELDADPHGTHKPDDSPPGPAALRIRCPHCGNPMELVDDDSLKDVLCTACGSRFSLVGRRDTTTHAHSEMKTVGQFQ